ncbi:MAG: ABC transporter substrate-binding protein, partial [Deltaproteobacteria bacterium]|nr:ABC transporter substrate-binding protein [Deltaproteobacteria bacterium]
MTERRAALALVGAGLAAVALGALRTPRSFRVTAGPGEAPRRILSLAVTADEILAPLVGASRLAAVTRFADDPFISTAAGAIPGSVPRVSAHDPEALLALEPDLALVAHFTLESAVRLLEATGTAVVRLAATRSFDDVEQNLLRVGRAVGELPCAEGLARELQSRLAAVRARVGARAAPRVLYYSAVGYTAGAGTLVDAKLTAEGARNVAREAGLSGFRSVALELFAALDPE